MASPTYRFGELRLDPARRELWRGDEELALPPKAFGCLVYLIENRDRAVGRDELIEAVWHKENLTDSVLGQAIVDARRALGGNGEEHPYIQTVRGFGYRWATPVETVESIGASTDLAPDRTRRVLRLLVVILAVGLLAAGTIYLWRRAHTNRPGVSTAVFTEADIALLLPVSIEAEERHPWIRLGVMDLIATRLRAAGQPMVPSDTVIALLRDHSVKPDSEEIDGLVATSGAGLVFGARAESTTTGWRVSLRSLRGAQPPLTSTGQAGDVLDAARLAADRMALSLGRVPVPDPAAEPGMALLLQQTEAAMLGEQPDVAGSLIEDAAPGLRGQPRLRLQQARIALHRFDLDAAQTGFESVLHDLPAARDPVLRAEALYSLGSVHFRREEYDLAESTFEAAARLLDEDDPQQIRGRIRLALGAVAQIHEDFDAARAHLAHARVALQDSGDVLGLATLENNLGVIETQLERHANALPFLERAAKLHTSLHSLGGELRSLSSIIRAHLNLLDVTSALAVESRLNELLARTTNPSVAGLAQRTKVRLLAASGRLQAASELLDEVLRTTETRDDLGETRLEALLILAERSMQRRGADAAAQAAAEVVEWAPSFAGTGWVRSSAWLIVVRAELARGNHAAATEAVTAMTDWAERARAPSPRIHAALARAELAAAAGNGEAAEATFERALALADTGHTPLRVLQVAESYVHWLLAEDANRVPNPDYALVVASRVGGKADRDYAAAALQVRAYHAVGSAAAWRAALARARSLAGERQIPAELQVPPRTR